MPADDFFARWSRPRQPESELARRQAPVVDPADSGPRAPTQPLEQPAPTIEEASRLTSDSDYSRFIARGVDESVKRLAMKRLFSDPRFNLMDGLDTYIDNYNIFEPIPPSMLGELNHAKVLLAPLAQLEKPLLELIQQVRPADLATPPGGADIAAASPPEPGQASARLAEPDPGPAAHETLNAGAQKKPDVSSLPGSDTAPPATPPISNRGPA